MTEPDPRRDVGPYEDANAALKQYAATTYGIPFDNEHLCGVVIRDGILMGGVKPSDFELEYLSAYFERHSDPIFAQLVQGWIIRAHIAGIDKGTNKF